MSEQGAQPYYNANNLKISNAISGRYPSYQTQNNQPSYQSFADSQINTAQMANGNSNAPYYTPFSKKN